MPVIVGFSLISINLADGALINRVDLSFQTLSSFQVLPASANYTESPTPRISDVWVGGVTACRTDAGNNSFR